MADYVIENYRIDPATGLFTRVASYITPSSGLEFYKRLNGHGQASFSFDIHDPVLNPNNFQLYRNNFLIKRNGGAAWLGLLNSYDTEMESNNGSARIRASEYFYHLNARHTSQDYQQVNVAAGTVAWDLIDTVQSRTNGELGITQGGIEVLSAISETLEYAPVDEAIMNLSDNVSGFDFWLDPILDANGLLDTVKFNVAKSRSRTITDKKITADQIMAISTSTDPNIYNTTTALAYGTGDQILTSSSEDTSSQSGFTRREAVVKLADYRIQENLDQAVTVINNETKVQRNILNITLRPGGQFTYDTIELGDIVTIDLTDPDFPPILRISGTARVIELNVRVDQNGVEYITPKFKFI